MTATGLKWNLNKRGNVMYCSCEQHISVCTNLHIQEVTNQTWTNKDLFVVRVFSHWAFDALTGSVTTHMLLQHVMPSNEQFKRQWWFSLSRVSEGWVIEACTGNFTSLRNIEERFSSHIKNRLVRWNRAGVNSLLLWTREERGYRILDLDVCIVRSFRSVADFKLLSSW